MSTTGPECRHLAAELRALRVRAGLSLAQLAAATTYSKSSWERYLNAKSLPPWAAVQELCRVADEPERALRALWELAEADWSGRGKVAANPAEAVAAEPVTDNDGDDDVTVPPPAKAVKVEQAEAPEQVAEPAQAETPDEPATAGQPEPVAAPVRRARRLHRLRSGTGLFAVVAVVCAMLTAGVAYAWRSDSPTPPAVPYWKAIRMGCSGASCVGQDAQQTGCGMGPTTVGPDYFTSSAGADLQFRYSTTCDTAWIKAWNAQVGDTVSLSTPGVATQDLLLANAFLASDGADTPMVTAGRGAVLRACLTPVGHPNDPQCFTERVP